MTLGANPNYDVTSTDASLTVSKAVATVKADATSKVYGTANPALTAVVTGQVPGGDAVAYTLATTATTHSNVGELSDHRDARGQSELHGHSHAPPR